MGELELLRTIQLIFESKAPSTKIFANASKKYILEKIDNE